ncbi:glycosyltransferase family 39 protein [Eubacteriales bacterium OttesenSCG-928-N13]|nr:glycosyltransferase family 39 protein [Eubacteriales bacterium OttesenSCG-928-N13]
MKRVLVILLLLLALIVMPTLAEDNLILNGDFEQITDAGLPENWSRNAWLMDAGVSDFTVSDQAYLGEKSICITNNQPNDARIVQRVAVEPTTYYQISCMVRASGISDAQMGANISIENTFDYSNEVFNTDGAWVRMMIGGITGEDQTEMVIMLRLGGYGSLNTGTAWFDDVQLLKLENAIIDDAGAISFATETPYAVSDDDWDDVDEDGGSGFQDSWMYIVLALYFALLLIVFFIRRSERPSLETKTSYLKPMIVMISLALMIRLVISVLVRGYEVDMNCFLGWSNRMVEMGPSGFYAADAFCDYPPGYLYVLWLQGGIRSLLNVPFNSPIDWMIIKLPSILMDLAAALLIYQIAKKHTGRDLAFLMACAYAFNPMAMLDSAAWGQIDSVLTILILVCIYAAMEDKWYIALPVYGLAVLCKPQALMLGPLGLTAVIVDMVTCGDNKKIKQILLSMLGTVLLMLLLSLPFIIRLDPALENDGTQALRTLLSAIGMDPALGNEGLLRSLSWLLGLYVNTVSGYSYITVNACNLYTLLDKNWVELGTVPGLNVLSSIMLVIGCIGPILMYIKAKDKRKIPLLAAVTLAFLFCFAPMMHERYLFPALVLLLVAFAMQMDVRLLITFGIFTAAQFMNSALVLQYEHLQSADQVLNAFISLLHIIGTALLCWTAWDLCIRDRSYELTRTYSAPTGNPRLQQQRHQQLEGVFRPRDYRLNLRVRDWVLMLLLTGAYALLSFSNLGVLDSPESTWVSTASGEQITFDLGATQDFRLTYYGSISDTNFKVQLSDDGEIWSQEYFAEYDQGQIFRWLWYEPLVEDEDTGEYTRSREFERYPILNARYVRLTMVWPGLILNEVAFLSPDGLPLPVMSIRSTGEADTKALLDEQYTVPAYPSYLNGTYFDEIYHARTGYENLNGLHTYEYTHPPLGKVLIALGISIFGMNPFGWRFMGALFGVLMIPLMYLLAKQLFKRSSLAFIAAFLFAVDCMHFTQTRIATIDTFVVFFILLMYLFMLRYTQMSFFQSKLWRTLIPLALCGIAMGLAISCKWTGVYGALGLPLLLFGTLYARYREYRAVKRNISEIDAARRPRAQRVQRQFSRNLILTLTWCVVFFIIVPLVIYYFSFYWQLTPDGTFNPAGVIKAQQDMFGYHSNLGADNHGFASTFNEWPLIIKPMWFYSGGEFQHLHPDMVSSISCMGNPAVWWVGFVAMLIVLGYVLLRAISQVAVWCNWKWAQPLMDWLNPMPIHDRRFVFIAIGFLAQYVPWMLVTRSTFIYHYFASVPFIILATVMLLEWIRRRNASAFRITAIALLVIALLLFAFFYPVISGTPMPRWYAEYLSWFNWVNFS